jgi:hypothetical protein
MCLATELVGFIGRDGLPYAIGSFSILAVFLIAALLKRHSSESKSVRQEENALAQEMIVRNAERAGWGSPRKMKYQHPPDADAARESLGTHWAPKRK